ncbi:DUF1128 domain-containing protein [Caldibacillus thermolactis]|uniref:UPF0435 protein OEV82_08665 n=1 Tax=Pallidibacillus thermolactis TaxID=251051 RepID=A0ABT2WKJ2_9BACI|nr:DUF1128 domain-containing protein [Pallidibacillus thermolactis]MCU9594527.1 DUF1128 domain-containing protein [Pallidibacillus thermolactis]MCU9601906.1 DUF1128 domain-containing protein [Pallidibacillus thermolactis subsp. kokeshiiformis]MED1673276.1 DUF1128 domain-containing protein [Pallidibacillus thermolactis subsp. kokeshiiformis]
MNLSVKSQENIEYMLEVILEKLNFINMDALKSSDINEERYEELVDIYELVMRRDSFSPAEIQAIAEELGNLRNK